MATKSNKIPSQLPLVGRGKGRWLVARYCPVSFFSLRMTYATSKGGKTLLVPTPYAVKMALIDACFRAFPAVEAESRARAAFDLLKEREVRLRPPGHCVVQNTFIKVLDAERDGDVPFKRTIAYREFAHFFGDLEVAIGAAQMEETSLADLSSLFLHVNTFGKRGSYWQFLECGLRDGELPVGFTVPTVEREWSGVSSYAVIQMLDDFGPALCVAKDGFDRISTYGAGRMKLGEQRVLVATALPYARLSAGRNFTWYGPAARFGE